VAPTTKDAAIERAAFDDYVRAGKVTTPSSATPGMSSKKGLEAARRLADLHNRAAFNDFIRRGKAAAAPTVNAAQIAHKAAPLALVRDPEFSQPADNMVPFSGYLARYEKDSQGDIIQPGAFRESIAHAEAERTRKGGRYLFPLLFNHDTAMPVGGIVSAKEDSYGLLVQADIDLSTSLGRDIHAALAGGYLDSMSIGYIADKTHYSGSARVLDRISLFEGSLVVLPANSLANVTAVQQ
jgi:HK97 family phage prohead protease